MNRLFQRIALCGYLAVVALATYFMFTLPDINGTHATAYAALLGAGAAFIYKIWMSNPNKCK